MGRSPVNSTCTRTDACTVRLIKSGFITTGILNLRPRTLNALIDGGIGSIEQLTQCTESKLGNLRGFGKKAMDEVLDALGKRNLDLIED